MKLGRNELCHCGSGKKYKRCCIELATNRNQGVMEDIAQVIAMNPDLSLDDLNALTEQRIQQANTQGIADFCGLSSAQMHNWMYAPLAELDGLQINTPADLSASPVMRYLEIILDEAMANEGSFKATSKGNLPAKLVKQASEILPEFAIAEYQIYPSISEFMGSNEDKFNALHYTRILAEITGIIYRRSGRYHVKKAAQQQYQTQGLRSFFLPMLETAVANYNWSYFDAFEDDIDLRLFWVFLLWRLQSHSLFEQLMDEVYVAFPALLQQLPPNEYSTPHNQLESRIETRFVKRFLEYWGFVTIRPELFSSETPASSTVNIQPLLTQTFTFTV